MNEELVLGCSTTYLLHCICYYSALHGYNVSVRLCIFCIGFNIIFVLSGIVAKKERVFVRMCYATYIVGNLVATY